MAAQVRRKLVIIEDGTLAGLAASPTAVAAFPFLRGLATAQVQQGKGKCGRCGRAAPIQASLYGAVKVAIANMPKDSKIKLKEILNAEQVRVIYRISDAKSPAKFRAISLTF